MYYVLVVNGKDYWNFLAEKEKVLNFVNSCQENLRILGRDPSWVSCRPVPTWYARIRLGIGQLSVAS